MIDVTWRETDIVAPPITTAHTPTPSDTSNFERLEEVEMAPSSFT